MKKRLALIFASLSMALLALAPAEPPSVAGHWEIEITFPERVRTCQFEAMASGKGIFSARTPEQRTQPGSNDDLTADWSLTREGLITLTGPIAFPLGNVGLERGRLILRGRFTGAGTLAGEASFVPMAQGPSSTSAQPTKRGVFTAKRSSR